MAAPFAIALALLAAVPAALVRLDIVLVPIEVETLCYGMAIVGASFAMAWGAEAAEYDVPAALALTAVALLAVLPEYAVDIVFAYKAGANPAFAPYAAANMTGSNRLLLGLGWPTVAVITWLAAGRRTVSLARDCALPLLFLSAATIYSFLLPLKSSINLIDTAVLFVLFGAYMVMVARARTEEPDLVGPAAAIGALKPNQRRLSVLGLLAFAGTVIVVCASPFADGLVQTGGRLGIDEFLLVQWLAPLASEAPEFLVAALLAAGGKSNAALALLLTSKLNQWTLLVGSLPLGYAAGLMAGHPGALSLPAISLPLDSRQVAEIWLTAAQGLFGVAVLANLVLELREALALAFLFLAQLVIGSVLRTVAQNAVGADQELTIFSLAYLALSLVFGVRARSSIGGLWRRVTSSTV